MRVDMRSLDETKATGAPGRARDLAINERASGGPCLKPCTQRFARSMDDAARGCGKCDGGDAASAPTCAAAGGKANDSATATRQAAQSACGCAEGLLPPPSPGAVAAADASPTCDARCTPAPMPAARTHSSSHPASIRLARNRSNRESRIGAQF